MTSEPELIEDPSADRDLVTELHRVLFTESPEAILLLTGDGHVLAANNAALRLYRTDLARLREFIGQNAVRGSSSDGRPAGDGRAPVQEVRSRPDGTIFAAEVGVVRVSMGGRPCDLEIVRDLTEQAQLQQELLQAQKMEAIGQLVSGVAHELNNPLAAIVAFSQLIQRDQRLPDDMRRDAELLVQEADRTRRIVRHLIDFARQRPPERHPTSIAALIESVLALQSYSISAGQINLTVDVPPDLPLIDIDRSQLQQVFLNLTLNAIQAIRAERTAGRIWITARSVTSGREPTRVRISVTDDGPGIAEAARPRLFLPFYTTKPPGQGTGLGLSVSFGIVGTHGGTLRFEPRPGGGATFVVELPASSDRPGTSLDAESTPQPTANTGSTPIPTAPSTPRDGIPGPQIGSAPRILVLDDEPAIRAFLGKALRQAGFDPVIAATGADAIDACRGEAFAAVLVDHRMPGMSGTEVFEAVVGAQPELGPRFVIMSGDVMNPDLVSFAQTHNVGLLAKPFDVDTVSRLVGDIVIRSATRAGAQRG